MSLFKELKKFSKTEKISMHIPGHKGGRGLGVSFFKNASAIDVTELLGTDNLQNPTGILKDSQEFCAKAFGADFTCFLTGGSSLGLRAAILGSAKRGDKLLVDRTCHRAVISAITLGGIEPIFISPDFDDKRGLYVGISADKVNYYLSKHPDICGAIITSPTYYGICSDIQKVADICHRFGKFLIVDEAHGAHFAFSKKLPATALSQGADICIQSAHKTLPALGQASFLHLKSGIIDKNRLMRTLLMIQSTSPSYLLMASLDKSARYMNGAGRLKLSRLIASIEELKKTVGEKTVLRFIDSDPLSADCDLTRLVVDFSPCEISGCFAEKLLIDEFNIYPEMSDSRYVVLIPTAVNTKAEMRQLANALISIGTRRIKGDLSATPTPLPDIELAYSPYASNDMPFESVPLSLAKGRISAGILSACPPGCAVLVPGQRITENDINYITSRNIAEYVDVICE